MTTHHDCFDELLSSLGVLLFMFKIKVSLQSSYSLYMNIDILLVSSDSLILWFNLIFCFLVLGIEPKAHTY